MDRSPCPLRPASLALAALCALTGAAGCQDEPSLLCDPSRLVWPFFDLDPADDSSPDEGVQIDLALRSSILPGTEMFLSVQGVDGEPVPHPTSAATGKDGALLFTDVNVPYGRIRLELTGHNECGDYRSVRTPFVWDGQGLPECTLDLGVEPVSVEGQALPVLRAEQDADPDAPGFQLEVTITAGRPDMTVSLFSLDPSTGEQEVREEESGDDLGAVFALTVGDGERSLRAVCEWAPEALRPSSPTVRLLVDTEGPDCALVQPASRVRAADDLDPETEGVQVELVGRSTAPDVVGQPGRFTFEGTEIAGSPIDEAGETSATATLTVEPGVAQTFTFAVADPAGNLCEASATFE